MAKVLKEYFGQVQCADAHLCGYGQQRDFLTYPYETNAVDWVITNPPFRSAEEFVVVRSASLDMRYSRANRVSRKRGSLWSYFRDNPPTKFAQFAERVPMASPAAGYAWLVWEKPSIGKEKSGHSTNIYVFSTRPGPTARPCGRI
jgi:hypothetical protein